MRSTKLSFSQTAS